MGFSVVVAYILLTISFLVAFTTFIDIYMNIIDINFLFEKKLNEEFIIHDCYNITPCSPCNFTAILNNTGKATINLKYLTVVFDGKLHNYTYSSKYLFPLESENITILNVSPTNLRLKIVTRHGAISYSNCRIIS